MQIITKENLSKKGCGGGKEIWTRYYGNRKAQPLSTLIRKCFKLNRADWLEYLLIWYIKPSKNAMKHAARNAYFARKPKSARALRHYIQFLQYTSRWAFCDYMISAGEASDIIAMLPAETWNPLDQSNI